MVFWALGIDGVEGFGACAIWNGSRPVSESRSQAEQDRQTVSNDRLPRQGWNWVK